MRGYKYSSDKSKAPDQRLQCVKALLKMGADADYCPKTTMMGCLHWAAYQGDAAVIRVLLKAGTDALSPTKSG